MDDSKLLQLLWDRSEDALDALSNEFGKRLYTTAFNILGDRQDAEEAVNDTYLAVWNAIPPARPVPLCAYIYKIGKNISLKKHRDQHTQKRDCGYTVSLDELADILPDGTLEDQLDAKQLAHAIDTFLDTLKKDDRILFLRRYWFGDSIPSLAKDRYTTESNISVRLHRIRARLKEHLIKEGYFL